MTFVILAYGLGRWTWSWQPALVGFLMESIGLRQLDKFHAIIGFAIKIIDIGKDMDRI